MGHVFSVKGFLKVPAWVSVSASDEEYEEARKELDVKCEKASFPGQFYIVRARFLHAEKKILIQHIKELRQFDGMTAEEFNKYLDDMEEKCSEHIEGASCSGS